MTCTEISELLPWLVNDRLEAEECERVEQHLNECGRCREELDEVLSTLRAADQHIPAPELVALVVGELGPGNDRQTLEGHLAHCASCRDELELVRESFRSLEDEKPRPLFGISRWRTLALAASMVGLVAAGGWWWTWWSVSSENADQLAEVGVPQVDLQVVELLPDDPVLRGSSGEEVATVTDTGTRPTVLLLLTSDVTDYEDHRVELRDANGRLLWEAEGLRRQPSGGFGLLLPPGSLTAEQVRISLSGKSGGRWKVIGTYRVRTRSVP